MIADVDDVEGAHIRTKFPVSSYQFKVERKLRSSEFGKLRAETTRERWRLHFNSAFDVPRTEL
jgi:hypothetical protein